jgi:Ca2+:H+ antiporter
LLFGVSLLAIIPLAAVMSHATEKVAERMGNAAGGLLSATMGNMTELIIGLTALSAGMFDLVKAAIAGAVISNGLFTMGLAFLVGGVNQHRQPLNLEFVHVEAALLLLATIALLVPSALYNFQGVDIQRALHPISLALSIILIFAYFLGLLFTLVTHPEIFESRRNPPPRLYNSWSLPVALLVLLSSVIAIAWVSEIFVESLTLAAESLQLSPAFIGFVLVALAGGAAEMYSAIHAAVANRPELTVSIALGSSTQISLFVAPVLVLLSYWISPVPMDLHFSAPAVSMILLSTFGINTILSSKHTTWYTGVLLLSIYIIFAITLYLVPLAG